MTGRAIILQGDAAHLPLPDESVLVASVLGRTGIGIDRSADYCRLAQWRCHDPAERARALQVPKPPPIPDGQEALFSLTELA